jgi:hypothetical protein
LPDLTSLNAFHAAKEEACSLDALAVYPPLLLLVIAGSINLPLIDKESSPEVTVLSL